MKQVQSPERALLQSALFVCLVTIACIATAASRLPKSCPADHIDEWVRVSFVNDGDTVRLMDGRHVRFIGINTPEIGYSGKKEQPYGREAREALIKLLGSNAEVGLRYDVQGQDAYQRVLAHLYLRDGTNIEAWMLEHGYATILPIPPDTWNIDCYHAAESRAREAGRGIWSRPEYQPVDVAALDRQANGYYLVKGRILRYSKKNDSIWINMENGLILQVQSEDLTAFQDLELKTMLQRQVTARGWVHEYKDKLYMRIRHPLDLEFE